MNPKFYELKGLNFYNTDFKKFEYIIALTGKYDLTDGHCEYEVSAMI